MKNKRCIICGKKHAAKGFCKSHYSSFLNGNISINGIPKDGHFFDVLFHLKKMKSTLQKLVKESPAYRNWHKLVIRRDKNCCSGCGKKNVKLVVHHRVRFSEIIKSAKKEFPDDVVSQLDFCLNRHSVDIGETLCIKCHAQKHTGEKVYNSLIRKNKTEICKVCGEPTYCKGFCSLHYSRFCRKVISENGDILINPKLSEKKGKCIVCGNDSVGRGGKRLKFCSLHLSRLNAGIIDENGEELRSLAHPQTKYHPCKVCGKNESGGKGFCITHYNRYKIGQIDILGETIRPLENFTKKGDRKSFYKFKGEHLTIKEIAGRIGIKEESLRKRIRKWGLERAFSTPPS